MADPDVVDAMRRSFLGRLPPEVVDALLADGERTDYPAGSTICRDGSALRAALGRCCVMPTRGTLNRDTLDSDRQGELVECDRQPLVHRHLDRQLVVSSSQVLHEGMPSDHDLGTVVLLETPHGTQSGLEPAVISLDLVVGVPLGSMPRGRQESSSTTG